MSRISCFQSLCLSIGNYSCYLLCLFNIAEEYLKTEFSVDKIFSYIACFTKQGYIYFNTSNYKDENNFYVKDPCGILRELTGVDWSVEKVTKKPVEKYYIEQWSVNGKTGHFARVYKGFNSLQSSNCVNNGKIISYRVFKEVK